MHASDVLSIARIALTWGEKVTVTYANAYGKFQIRHHDWDSRAGVMFREMCHRWKVIIPPSATRNYWTYSLGWVGSNIPLVGWSKSLTNAPILNWQAQKRAELIRDRIFPSA